MVLSWKSEWSVKCLDGVVISRVQGSWKNWLKKLKFESPILSDQYEADLAVGSLQWSGVRQLAEEAEIIYRPISKSTSRFLRP